MNASTEHNMISVIMPCYNDATFVEQAVASVMEQSHQNLELIVVDDGSTDDSWQILQSLADRYGQKLVLLQQENSGPYPARNLAIQQATGDWIAFLDADDYWDTSALEKLLHAATAAGADAAYCGWQNTGNAQLSSKPHIPPDFTKRDIVASFLKGCPWPIHAALVKRACVMAINGFSERLFSSMDYDFWLRILAHTRNIVLEPSALAYYRWHDQGQISHTKWRQFINAFQVRKDFVDSNPELVAHLSRQQLKTLLSGQLVNEARRAFWNRDQAAAQALFRFMAKHGLWTFADIKFILPCLLLPGPLLSALFGAIDRVKRH